jgi:transcriptional regulator with XRE-family HTH domain
MDMPGMPNAFGENLTKVLVDKHWSVPDLARALNVERSLVYKWRRGERTPGLSSGYVARIAILLDLSPPQQAELEASQLKSLRAPHAHHPTKQLLRGDVQGLLNLNPTFGSLASESLQPIGAERMRGKARSPAIHGRTEALLAALERIENAPAPANQSDREATTILITSLEWGHENTSAVLEYSEQWHSVARHAMARGWHICHLMRLDKDARRSLAMARTVLDLIGSGKYTALYFYANELILPACELALIPGNVAMLFYATQTFSSVDAATVVNDREQIAVLQQYFQRLAGKAKPLLETFAPQDWVALEQLRADAEEEYWPRVIVKDGLSRITEPIRWANPESQRAKRPGFTGDALNRVVNAQKRRLAAFEAHVGQHIYRDICPMRSVVRLVREGHYLHNDTESQAGAPQKERVDQLVNVISLLRRFHNYEIALVDESQESDVPVLQGRFWEVIGGMRVFTNALVPDQHGGVNYGGILIAEPSIVGAFRHYFDTLWSNIAPRNKDKEFVIWWFERQLQALQLAQMNLL